MNLKLLGRLTRLSCYTREPLLDIADISSRKKPSNAIIRVIGFSPLSEPRYAALHSAHTTITTVHVAPPRSRPKYTLASTTQTAGHSVSATLGEFCSFRLLTRFPRVPPRRCRNLNHSSASHAHSRLLLHQLTAMAPIKGGMKSARGNSSKSTKSSIRQPTTGAGKSRVTQKVNLPPPKQQKTKSASSMLKNGVGKKKRKVYTDKELGLPKLNMITPVGVEAPRGKKRGKVFVDDAVSSEKSSSMPEKV